MRGLEEILPGAIENTWLMSLGVNVILKENFPGLFFFFFFAGFSETFSGTKSKLMDSRPLCGVFDLGLLQKAHSLCIMHFVICCSVVHFLKSAISADFPWSVDSLSCQLPPVLSFLLSFSFVFFFCLLHFHFLSPPSTLTKAMKVKVFITELCPTLCDPMDYSPPGSSVHGIPQARILEWIAISFSRGSSWPRDQTWVSCIAGRFFTIWATREAWPRPYKPGFPSLSRQKAYHDTLWEGASQFSKGIRSVMSVGSFARVMETF